MDTVKLRDKKRIPEIITKLQKIWEANPDLRFFQVIELLKSKDPKNTTGFYTEDSELLIILKLLEKQLENTKKSPNTRALTYNL
jgi:uncharacterized protein YihD (DUF1040 family)